MQNWPNTTGGPFTAVIGNSKLQANPPDPQMDSRFDAHNV
jgi:hypothetical protein